jgi:hypothetical protein
MNATVPSDLKTYKIHLWHVYNLLESDEKSCEHVLLNGKVCGHKCNFMFSDSLQGLKYSCKTHVPKDKLDSVRAYKRKLVSDIILQDIAGLVVLKVQEIFNENKVIFDQLREILIELQPKINPKMKFISHVVFGKLTDLFLGKKEVTIRFVSASKKLKINYQGPVLDCPLKGEYVKRKWLSVKYCVWFLENLFSEEESKKWLGNFLNADKADDMADVFLMCINSIFGLKKKTVKSKIN